MHSLARGLENSSWVVALTNSRWMYSTCEVAHYFSLFVLVGTVIILDLRILGIAARGRPAAELAALFLPWSSTALGVVAVSGFLMFTTDAVEYVPNKVFYVKLVALLLAAITSFVVFQKASQWDLPPIAPWETRLLAILSLLFWIGTIIAAVEIPAITGVG